MTKRCQAETLDEKVLAHIASRIGDLSPTNRDMAERFDATISQIDHSISRLKQAGKIMTNGGGSSRVLHVPDVGHTLPRVGRMSEVRHVAEITHERIENSFPCPRCGCRSGCSHTASVLTANAERQGWRMWA